MTRNDIKIGMVYHYIDKPDELFRIIDIVSNPKAGEPIKDMWGGVVWEEPAYTIKGVSLSSGRELGFVVQSETESLDNYIKFI